MSEGVTLERNMIDQRFKGNVLFGYGAQVVTIGLGFASITIITRFASIEVYGMVAMLTALAGVLTNLLTFRTNEAVINFYKRGEVERKPGLCRLALTAGLILDAVVGLLLVFIVQYFAAQIASHLLKDPNAVDSVIAHSIVMLIMFLRGTGYGLLIAEERFRYINSLSILEQAARLSLLAAIVVAGITLTLTTIILVMLASGALVTALMYFGPLDKLFGVLRHASLARENVGEYTRFSISTFASSTLKAGTQNVDSIILGYITNPTNVGIYTLLRQFLSPIAMMAGPFSAQIYPRFVHAVAERRRNDVHQTIKHVNHLLAKGFIVMLAVITPIVAVYGYWNDLRLGAQHFLTYGFMAVNAYVFQQLWWSRPFAVSHDPNISLVSNLIYALLVLVLVYTLTVELGLPGTALGMLLSALLILVYWQKALKRFSD